MKSLIHKLKSLFRKPYHDLRRLARTLYIECRLKPQTRRIAGNHLKLNLGCGRRVMEGWINLDSGFDWNRDLPDGAYYADFSEPIPLPDACAFHIHCEHFLDYLEKQEAHNFLRECHRLLEPGGTLRIILTDMAKYCHAYTTRDKLFFEKLRYLGNTVNPLRLPADVLNRAFHMGGSKKYLWDKESMQDALTRTGFCNIEESGPGQMAKELNIDGTEWWRSFESFYLNACKPQKTSPVLT